MAYVGLFLSDTFTFSFILTAGVDHFNTAFTNLFFPVWPKQVVRLTFQKAGCGHVKSYSKLLFQVSLGSFVF